MKIEIHVNGARRHKNGLADIVIQVPSLSVKRRLDISLEEFVALFGVPETLICDFLLVASIVYTIDKSVSRSHSEDRWTRHFEVRIPVNDPKRWNRIASQLNATLSFLSGDTWDISFRTPGSALFVAPKKGVPTLPQKASRNPGRNAVSLFSGGLDSLAGAIDLLENDHSIRVVLVGHFDHGGPGAQQRRLFTPIKDKFGARAQLLQMKVGHRPSGALEPSSRCRSFLFIALGISAAASLRSDIPLFAHENGVIAVNLPLNPARGGSCSTRTMHPYFLEAIRKVLRELGLTNPIYNPFASKTKGECMVDCLNQALLKQLYLSAVSCAHGNRRQHWKRKSSGNCGYCMPCIFRRAALHKLKIDSGKDYGMDFCTGEIEIGEASQSSDDLRAMIDFLRRPRSKDVLLREAYRASPVPSREDVGAMLSRGYGEVAELLRTKGKAQLLRAAAIK